MSEAHHELETDIGHEQAHELETDVDHELVSDPLTQTCSIIT